MKNDLYDNTFKKWALKTKTSLKNEMYMKSTDIYSLHLQNRLVVDVDQLLKKKMNYRLKVAVLLRELE